MLYGDVPEQDRELVKNLIEMEASFKEKEGFFPPADVATGYVCLAHDYYEVGLDEKGAELLERAEKACPGYFKNQISKYIESDPDFEYLVQNLRKIIVSVAKSVILD